MFLFPACFANPLCHAADNIRWQRKGIKLVKLTSDFFENWMITVSGDDWWVFSPLTSIWGVNLFASRGTLEFSKNSSYDEKKSGSGGSLLLWLQVNGKLYCLFFRETLHIFVDIKLNTDTINCWWLGIASTEKE